MFGHTLVHPDYRKYLLILWSFGFQEPVQEFELETIIFVFCWLETGVGIFVRLPTYKSKIYNENVTSEDDSLQEEIISLLLVVEGSNLYNGRTVVLICQENSVNNHRCLLTRKKTHQ